MLAPTRIAKTIDVSEAVPDSASLIAGPNASCRLSTLISSMMSEAIAPIAAASVAVITPE